MFLGQHCVRLAHANVSRISDEYTHLSEVMNRLRSSSVNFSSNSDRRAMLSATAVLIRFLLSSLISVTKIFPLSSQKLPTCCFSMSVFQDFGRIRDEVFLCPQISVSADSVFCDGFSTAMTRERESSSTIWPHKRCSPSSCTSQRSWQQGSRS